MVGLLGFIVVILFLIYLSLPSLMSFFSKKKSVVIYELKGPIVNYEQTESIYLQKVLSDLDSIEENYDGIILKIDSPGGDAYSTKKIAERIKEINKKIPIVACIDQIATSGAYWLASSSDYIVADDFSIVGSIGVYASYLEFTGLMEKLGVKYNRIVFGKYKDILSPFKNLTEEERKLIERKINYIYEYFVKEVAKNRGLNYSFVKEKIATGEFFFGYEAKELNLVDAIGDLETCKKKMAHFLNTSIDNIKFQTMKGYYEKELNWFGFSLGYGLASFFFEKIPQQVKIN
ncbi:MAG TPA: signal peptide peptidase SppA [Nautiliaceae bacterium]|nr:signal peptide peptidase SppA [Nautiliaceae bacterium]